jgi:hypothetical protein
LGVVVRAGAKMIIIGVARKWAGILLTRRVRRSRVLAHKVSDKADSLAMLASTVRKALATTLQL